MLIIRDRAPLILTSQEGALNRDGELITKSDLERGSLKELLRYFTGACIDVIDALQTILLGNKQQF